MPTQCVESRRPVWSCCKARSTCSSSARCWPDPATATRSPNTFSGLPEDLLQVETGSLYPASPPAGGEGLDRGLLGAVRQRQARQVLSPHAARAQTTRRRTIEMGGVLPRHGIDLESGRSGGTMNSFFRKLRWLTQRRNKEAELREELQFHLEEEAEQRQAEGLAEEERPLGGAPRTGQPHPGAGEHSRRVGMDHPGATRPGPALRASAPWPPTGCLRCWRSCRWRWESAPTQRSTASWIRSCCARCRCPIPESLVVLNWHAEPPGATPS